VGFVFTRVDSAGEFVKPKASTEHVRQAASLSPLAVTTQEFDREDQRQAGSLSDIAEFASRIVSRALSPRVSSQA